MFLCLLQLVNLALAHLIPLQRRLILLPRRQIECDKFYCKTDEFDCKGAELYCQWDKEVTNSIAKTYKSVTLWILSWGFSRIAGYIGFQCTTLDSVFSSKWKLCLLVVSSGLQILSCYPCHLVTVVILWVDFGIQLFKWTSILKCHALLFSSKVLYGHVVCNLCVHECKRACIHVSAQNLLAWSC